VNAWGSPRESARDQALTLVRGALAAIEGERQFVNDLNVYPVPDGDTGTNLALTVRAVLAELERSQGEGILDVAAAVTKGSLMGARGNSGVILSQIVRGVCEVFSSSGRLDTAYAKRALQEGTAAAYRAVRKPVEGTMLTVVREMATAAQDVSDGAPLATLVAHVAEAGRLAVERTPQQLAVLRKAGVVDAGGYGLLVLFRGLLASASGEGAGEGVAGSVEAAAVLAPGAAASSGAAAQSARVPIAANAAGVAGVDTYEVRVSEPSELSRYRYCTSLVITGDGLEHDEVEEFVAARGDSALVVGDASTLKIHVHTDDPGELLSYAVKLGAIGGVEINDMHAQTVARDERLAVGEEHDEAPATAVAAVVAGAGNQELFRSLGCAAVVDGGQSMNPSAAQLLEAISSLRARAVVVLPNNSNVVLTAEQAATMAADRPVFVVPSTSVPAGLAAMVAFDHERDGAGNADEMRRAVERVRSAEVTHAVRDSEVDGVRVRKGQVIGLVDDDLVAAGDDLLEVFGEVVRRLAEKDVELITVLTSLNGWSVTPEELSAVVAEACPVCEVSLHDGGQPLYPLLVSAE
jgi:DAK2 domain fusion protein YloV